MYWPRFRLTKAEAQKWCPYSAPGNNLKAVLYRAYAGELQLSTTNREDTENLQISRRARVFAFTCSGDVNNIEVNIYDSIGEQYTMGFVPVSNLMLGTNPDFRGFPVINGPPDAFAFGPTYTGGIFPYGVFSGDTQAPHIFEPNIGLDPNQTLSVKGRTMRGLTNSTFFPPDQRVISQTAVLSFVMHVWEFPVE